MIVPPGSRRRGAYKDDDDDDDDDDDVWASVFERDDETWGGTLEIVDSRTGSAYRIPISEDGTSMPPRLKILKCRGRRERVGRVRPGVHEYQSVRVKISFIDGNKGILRYRGRDRDVSGEVRI